MLRPTLIIGLGSSGLEVVNEVQKLLYETFGVNTLPLFKMVYFETDSGKAADKTPAGSSIIPVRLQVRSLQEAIRVLRNKGGMNLDWVSDDLPSQLTNTAQGAGGVRPAGRLLLWGDANFANAYGALRDAWNAITNVNVLHELPADLVAKAGGVSNHPVVYVVGTLVGGTASGTFIDIGYMIRHICGFDESGALYGLFLVPPEGRAEISMGYGNTYGALTELEFFRSVGSFYQETWPNGVHIPPNPLPPYALTYLVSPSYGEERFGQMTLQGCYKAVGLRLYCDLIGLSDLRGAVLIDGMAEGFGFYATFGIAGIIFPKYALTEATACQLGRDLCDRWLRRQAYQGADGQDVQINEAGLLVEAKRALDEALTHAVSQLDQQGSQANTFEGDLMNLVDRILDKREDNPARALVEKFVSGRDGNYYAGVRDNAAGCRDALVRSFREFIVGHLARNQNLHQAEELIAQLQHAIRQTIEYWTRSEISGDATAWNQFVNAKVRRIFETPNRLFLQRGNTIEDRALDLLRRLKMFVLREVLQQLSASLDSGHVVTLDQKVSLPTLQRVRSFRQKFDSIRADLAARADAIGAEVGDTQVPLYRVWSNGSFLADRDALLSAYRSQSPTPSFKDVETGDLWQVLSERSPAELFESIKVGYQGRLKPLLRPLNPIEVATENASRTAEYASRALAGLLSLDTRGRSGQHGVPRFVLGADENGLNRLVQKLRQEGLNDFDTNHVRQLPLLDHAVVLYDEQANINPGASLRIRETARRHFENPSRDSTGQAAHSAASWREQRLAYGIDRRERRIKLVGLVDFCVDFGLRWMEQPSGALMPVSVRWPELPLTLEDPPQFRYTHQGVPRQVRLSSSEESLGELSKNAAAADALAHAVVAVVRTKGREELARIYRDEIMGTLQRRLRTESDLVRRTDYYFGDEDRSNGLLGRMLTWNR